MKISIKNTHHSIFMLLLLCFSSTALATTEKGTGTAPKSTNSTKKKIEQLASCTVGLGAATVWFLANKSFYDHYHRMGRVQNRDIMACTAINLSIGFAFANFIADLVDKKPKLNDFYIKYCRMSGPQLHVVIGLAYILLMGWTLIDRYQENKSSRELEKAKSNQC